MSIDQSIRAANASRHTRMSVSLSSQLVNRLAVEARGSARARGEIAGLLFGLTEKNLTHIEALRPFPEADRISRAGVLPATFEGLVKTLLKASQADPETAALNLAGWYSVRTNGSLDQIDIAFHERHFHGLGDVAVMVKPEGQAGISLAVYARSAQGVLTQEEHRRGELRLPGGAEPGPVQVALSPKAGDQLYLRAYEITRSLDRADRREPWKDIVQSTKRVALWVLSLRPGAHASSGPGSQRLEARAVSLSRVETTEPEAPVPTGAGVLQPMPAGERTGLPEREGRHRPWGLYAAIFTITVAVIFAALGFFRKTLPDREMDLRAESKGGSILLSWNRLNPIVQSATGGSLQIDDGAQHREVQLDAEQIVNGSLLYRPVSDDVTFRIEMRGERGATIRRSLRVLDGEKRQLAELNGPRLPANSAARIDPSATPPRRQPSSRVRAFPELVRLPEHRSRSAPDTASQQREPEPGDVKRATVATPKGTLLPDPRTAPEPPSNTQLPDFVATPEPELALPKLEPAESRAAQAIANPSPSAAGTNPAQTGLAIAPTGDVAAAYVPPRPLRQFTPNPKPWVIAAPSEIAIEVKLDKNGHVETARLLRQDGKLPGSLVGAALAAAKQWTFKPATLRGIKVESNDTIVFRFRPANP